MRPLPTLLLASAAFVLGASTAQAQIRSAEPGTPFTISTITESATGASMSGMNVNVCLASAGCVDHTWRQLTPDTWGVEADGFRIRVGSNSDTFTSDWRFDLWRQDDLQTVTFSGFGGNTVFDRTWPLLGTPGSSFGNDADLRDQCLLYYLTLRCIDFDDTRAEYFNQVSLGNTFYGDLYESVFLDFTNVQLTGVGASDGLDVDFTSQCFLRVGDDCRPAGFYLRMDSENGDLRQVPEPASLALLAVGSLGLVSAARRRRR